MKFWALFSPIFLNITTWEYNSSYWFSERNSLRLLNFFTFSGSSFSLCYLEKVERNKVTLIVIYLLIDNINDETHIVAFNKKLKVISNLVSLLMVFYIKEAIFLNSSISYIHKTSYVPFYILLLAKIVACFLTVNLF